MTPLNPKDFVVDEKIPKRYKDVSLFRGSRKIYVYQQMTSPPEISLNFQIKQGVGGFLGFGNTEVTTQCVLTQNEFYPGNKIPIKIICDNKPSKCAVKNFKFKLYRLIRAKQSITGTFDTTEKKICQVKESGCKAGELFQRDFLFEIPMKTKDKSRESNIPGTSSAVHLKDLDKGKALTTKPVHVNYDEDEKPMQNLAGSWLGSLFSIDYCLRVFVKYDSFLKRGEG